MARIEPVVSEKANASTRQLLEAVNKKLGLVPNVIATMANSEAVASGYLGLSQSLATGSLPARLREQIALLVAEANSCDYCLAAHSAMGKRVPEFAAKVVSRHGMVTDQDLQAVRAAGYSDGDIMEIVANITLNILTNYVNLVAGTSIDFPAAPVLSAA